MNTLSDNEIRLYKSCFDTLNSIHEKYQEYEKQILGSLDVENLTIEDLKNILNIAGQNGIEIILSDMLNKKLFIIYDSYTNNKHE